MSITATVAERDRGQLVEQLHEQVAGLKLCHFTVAHTELKSRSFHRMCLPLAQAGATVTYVAPIKAAQAEGVDFVSLRADSGRLRRALFNPELWRSLLRAEASLYHFQDAELLPLGLVLQTIFRKHVIYDAYEDFPAMARESKSIPRAFRGLAAFGIELAEWLAAHALDGVTTADPFTLRRFARSGKSRKLVFHNFPNLNFFPAPPIAHKPFDIVYRGGISERAGTYVLLDAMRRLDQMARAPRLLLIGYFDNTAAEKALLMQIRNLGLESRVEILGRIGHEQMAQTLALARIGVCPLQSTPKFSLNLPVKVFEYWACGLPVIASDLRPIRPYFQSTEAGFLFAPHCSTELATSIAWLLDHPQAAREMGQNGRAAVVERFNNRAEMHKFGAFCAALARSAKIGARERPSHA